MSHPVLLLTSTREEPAGTSFVIQWLRLCASNAGGAVLTPGLETKTPHAPCAVLSHSVVSDSLEPRGLNPAKLLCHGHSWLDPQMQNLKYRWSPGKLNRFLTAQSIGTPNL